MKQKWYRAFEGNFIEITEPLDTNDVNDILHLRNLDRVQLSPPLNKFNETFKLLNNYLFSTKPQIGLRIYGNRDDFTDLNFLQLLPQLERFAIDEWYLQDINPLSFVENLTELSIGETKSIKVSYAPLANLRSLKKLYINGSKKDMDAISKLTNLQTIYLNSVTLDSLEILLPLSNLTELHINLGGIRNFDLLPKIGKIETLELCWIKELPEENLYPVARMSFLKSLILDRLPKIRTVKWLMESKIKDLTLAELKGLESIKGVEEILNLEKLIIATRVKDNSIEPILSCKRLKEIFLPLTWGKKNLLVVDAKFPHFGISQYIDETERRIKELKGHTNN